MRRKLIAAALTLALLLCTLVGVFAFEDTNYHWARESIDRAVELGLFHGVSETEFDPDAPMTRAMFVTVLGRLAGIDPVVWQCDDLALMFRDVDGSAYYAPYLAWAVHTGVASGTGSGKFTPDGNVTREQMARFIANYLQLSGSSLLPPAPEEGEPDTEPTDVPETSDPDELPILPLEPDEDNPRTPEQLAESLIERLTLQELALPSAESGRTLGSLRAQSVLDGFADAELISDWAADSIVLLAQSGLLRGIPENGLLYFAPQKNASRAECATLFCRLYDNLIPPEEPPVAPASLVLNETSVILEAGEQRNLFAAIFPVDAFNQHIVWYSTNPDVVSVDSHGVMTGVGEGVEFVFAATCNRIVAQCEVTVTVEHTPFVPGSLGHAGMSDDEKDMMIFGQLVDDPRTFYPDDATAKQHLVWVEVPVWILNADGTKSGSTLSVEVHENIAATVEAIFNEIYAQPEQPPIHGALGWYGPTTRSEHRPGLAIDINVNENPYVSPSGQILVGDHFSPETDPYSIPIGGTIDQIFAKYGFTRGIFWNSGYKDYMHYSFYGT